MICLCIISLSSSHSFGFLVISRFPEACVLNDVAFMFVASLSPVPKSGSDSITCCFKQITMHILTTEAPRMMNGRRVQSGRLVLRAFKTAPIRLFLIFLESVEGGLTQQMNRTCFG